MSQVTGKVRGEYAKSSVRRQQILEAALEVFSASGYHKGSLRDVAERAGLSQAGLLHHFPSKIELTAAVLAWRDDLSRSQFGTADLSGSATIVDLVDLVEHNQSTPMLVELYATLSAEAATPGHPLFDYFARRYAWVVDFTRAAFERAAEAGQLRPGVDPGSAARGLIALMDGLQIQWLYDRASVDMTTEVRVYLRSLLAVEL